MIDILESAKFQIDTYGSIGVETQKFLIREIENYRIQPISTKQENNTHNGFQLVPIEPTEEMIFAAKYALAECAAILSGDSIRRIIKAAISGAPKLEIKCPD